MNVFQVKIYVKLELTATIPKVYLLASSLISESHSHDSGLSIVNLEHISQLFLVFLLLKFNR